MTEPSPAAIANVDQMHADADYFISTVLTDVVSRLQAGEDHDAMTAHVGVGLVTVEMAPQQMIVVGARALARLARLHHAVEQLADTHDANGMPNAAAELRKLVDDHG